MVASTDKPVALQPLAADQGVRPAAFGGIRQAGARPLTPQAIRGLLGNSWVVVHKGNVVAFIAKDSPYIPAEETATLTAYLKRVSATGGLSNRFCELAELRRHYLQSLQTVESAHLQRRGRGLHRFEDYAIEILLEASSNSEALQDFLHPAVLRLAEYDRLHNSSYSQSATAYLKSMGNTSQAAQSICISNSALAYRLARVRQIGKVNLADPDTAFQMLLSLKILAHQGMLAPDGAPRPS
jgi:sugar diacid utilization regulator